MAKHYHKVTNRERRGDCMDVWTVRGTIVTLVGRTSGSYMHAIGKTSQKNFDKGVSQQGRT